MAELFQAQSYFVVFENKFEDKNVKNWSCKFEE